MTRRAVRNRVVVAPRPKTTVVAAEAVELVVAAAPMTRSAPSPVGRLAPLRIPAGIASRSCGGGGDGSAMCAQNRERNVWLDEGAGEGIEEHDEAAFLDDGTWLHVQCCC